MVVYIDGSVAEYLEERSFTMEQKQLFITLGSAYYYGKCVVIGDLRSLKALRALEDAFNVYGHILGKYAENGALLKLVNKVVVITFEENAEKRRIPTGFEGKCIYLTINEASIINWLIGTAFVCENLADCEFYKYIGYYYSAFNKCNLPIQLHYEHGGGNETGKVLEKCVVVDKALTLCISDVDLKYGCTRKYGVPCKGATYKEIKKIVKKLSQRGYNDRFEYKNADVHEIENLIPLSVLKKLEDNYLNKEGIAVLEYLLEKNNGNPILYYDFKNGVEITSECVPFNYYWRLVFSTAEDLKEQIVFPRIICRRIMEHVNKTLKEISISEIVLDDYLKETWGELGKSIFTWGCAVMPLRS